MRFRFGHILSIVPLPWWVGGLLSLLSGWLSRKEKWPRHGCQTRSKWWWWWCLYSEHHHSPPPPFPPLLLLHFFSPRMDGWQGCRWVWHVVLDAWNRNLQLGSFVGMVGWRWIDKRRVCGWVMDSQQFCTDIYIHRLEIVECGPLINYFGDDSPTN